MPRLEEDSGKQAQAAPNLMGVDTHARNWHHTDEARKRIGQARQGVPRTPEAIEAIKAGLIGHVISAETRTKIQRNKLEKAGDTEKLLWLSAVDKGLIPVMLTRRILSQREVDILKRNFKRRKSRRNIPDGLWEKFCLVAAKLD